MTTSQLDQATADRGMEALDHVVRRIEETPIDDWPTPHCYVREIFPSAYYQEILRQLPSKEHMQSLSETGRVSPGAYRERLVLLLEGKFLKPLPERQREFWRECWNWLSSEAFLSALLFKFQATLMQRFNQRSRLSLVVGGDGQVVNDQTNYAIGPHTDAPLRAVSILFYLPKDESQKGYGTSFYRPKKPGLTNTGGKHMPRELFDLVKTLDYLPNTAVLFPRTNSSFHGVERITETDVNRHLLIFNARILEPPEPN